MIRRPTPLFRLLAWHSAALAGKRPQVFADDPQCGWFRTRLVKRGPWVPARIWCEQETDPLTGDLTAPEVLRAEVNGQPRDPEAIWLSVANNPITKQAFLALEAEHARNPRMAATHVALDLTAAATRPA